MINKLKWTRVDPKANFKQFEFEMPTGFKIFTIEKTYINPSSASIINLGVFVKCDEPITAVFSPALYSVDFMIANPIQMISPGVKTELKLTVVNPVYEGACSDMWSLEEGSHIANMILFNTSYTNLFEISYKEFERE